MTKLFVVGGYTGDAFIDSVEVIDLSGEGKTCSAPKSFPVNVGTQWGSAKTKDGEPLVCGGHWKEYQGGRKGWIPTCYKYCPIDDRYDT